MKTLTFLIIALTSVFSISCTQNKAPIGDKSNPLKLMFVPSDDAQGIMLSAQHLTEFFNRRMSEELYGKSTGFYIKASVPNSYIAVVEAFGTNRADLAIMNTYGYYLLRSEKKFPVEAIIKVMRGDGELSYKSQIITRSDSKINSLNDLKGKKFAFTDPASTSGFVIPSAFLNKAGIKLGEVVFGAKHDSVVTMVYQGQVDAGATYYFPPSKEGVLRDARTRVKTQFPDVMDKVKIVTYTDSIPNAPWVLRSNLYEDAETYKKVRDALKKVAQEYAQNPAGKQRLEKEWGITGLVATDDRDFDEAVKIFDQAKQLAKQYH
jgi:phosphonate transport system substrate-binding protein